MSDIDLGVEHLTDPVQIGRGGFSTVYAATNALFDRRVAVKVLNRVESESDRRRFERECKVMGRLSTHPNVVTVYSAGFTGDGRPYIEMELIEGGTLADRVARQGPVPWPQAVEHVVDVARALGVAHEAEILHRDIKPENILLAGDEPRLTDFGIAYLRDATGATSTHVSASWLHSPPETFENKRDARSDLYSLGSTLFTIIVGVPPFWRGGDESLSPLMYRLLNEAPPRLPAESGPADLADVIDRSLAKDPDHRYQSTAEFVTALERVRAAHGLGPSAATGGAAGGGPDLAGYAAPSGPPDQTQFAAPTPQPPATATPGTVAAAHDPYQATPPPHQSPPPHHGTPAPHHSPQPQYGTPPPHQSPPPHHGTPAPHHSPQPQYGTPPPHQSPPPHHGTPAPHHSPQPQYGTPPPHQGSTGQGAGATVFADAGAPQHGYQVPTGPPQQPPVHGGGQTNLAGPPVGPGGHQGLTSPTGPPPGARSGNGGRIALFAILGLVVLALLGGVGAWALTRGPSVPGPVTALTITEGASSVTLGFAEDDSGEPADYHEVSVNDGPWERLPTSGEVTGLSNGVEYEFRVRGVNEAGVGDAVTAPTTGIPYGRPDAPTVNGQARDGRITWTWVEPFGNGREIVGYWIQLDDGEQSYQEEATFTSERYGPLEDHQLTVWAVNGGPDDDLNTSEPRSVTVSSGGTAQVEFTQSIRAVGPGGVEMVRGPQPVEVGTEDGFSWRLSCQFLGAEYISTYWEVTVTVERGEAVVTVLEQLRYDPANAGTLFDDTCSNDGDAPVVAENLETLRFPLAADTYPVADSSLAGDGATNDSTERSLVLTLEP